MNVLRCCQIILGLGLAAVSGCRATTWCCHIDPPEPCGQFDTEVQPLLPDQRAPAGFSAEELDGLLRDQLTQQGQWVARVGPREFGSLMTVDFDAETTAAVAVERLPGQGFSAYTPDNACPSGPLVRMPVTTSLSYAFGEFTVSWTIDQTVEATALAGEAVLLHGTLDLPSERFDEPINAMFESMEDLKRADGIPDPPKAREREGVWVDFEGTLLNGSHELKGYWSNGQASVMARYVWPESED